MDLFVSCPKASISDASLFFPLFKFLFSEKIIPTHDQDLSSEEPDLAAEAPGEESHEAPQTLETTFSLPDTSSTTLNQGREHSLGYVCFAAVQYIAGIESDMVLWAIWLRR